VKPEATIFLVILEEGSPSVRERGDQVSGNSAESPDADPRLAALRQELQAKEEYLKASNEELKTSNEELKSAGEEMQSVNEELQSTNEELETSKEELQSVNEELATVNSELETKVADLSRANNDMNNLLAGTGIGTVFVDHQLRVLRFTPAATQIINLIPGDMGRPLDHVVSNLVGYDHLVADVHTVLDTLVPKENEVQTTEGKWYTLRIQLYRTLDNVIEGAVITFVDISATKRAEAEGREYESLFRQLAASLPQLVWTCRPDGFYDYVSPQWVEFTGLPEAQQLGFKWLDRVHPDDRGALMTAWNKAMATGEPFHIGFRLRRRSGAYHGFTAHASALLDTTGHIVKWFGLNTETASPGKDKKTR
jgi:two-component system CheB/CheR fusion protein